MFLSMGVRVLGIVENMSGMICPHCGKSIDVFKTGGGRMAAEEIGVPFLGAIPLDAKIVGLGDMGQTFVEYETPAAKAFSQVVDALLFQLQGEAQEAHQSI
jgi:ATP-binding protein involved in chromosome partitioning